VANEAKNKSKARNKDGRLLVAQNRRAKHDWEIEDRFEVGLVLLGTEVKALRAGLANLADAYAALDRDELWVHKMHIGACSSASPLTQHQPLRSRKLLMKRAAIERLRGKLERKGFSLVVMEIYFQGPWAKVLLGLGRGKNHRDRRDEIKRADADLDAARAMRRGRR